MENEDTSKKIILFVIISTIVVVSIIGIAFASYTLGGAGKKEDIIKNENITLNYTSDTNVLTIDDTNPISDSNAMLKDDNYFEFDIVSDVGNIAYEISATRIGTSSISDNNIKIALEEEQGEFFHTIMEPKNYISVDQTTEIGTPKGSMLLLSVESEKKVKRKYRVRLWMTEATPTGAGNDKYSIKINLHAKLLK